MQFYEHKIYEKERKKEIRTGKERTSIKKVRMTLAFVIVRRLFSGQGNFS